ncbi:hypothetical protein ACFQJD_03485 [Haloplanus sp. GCM10025708]|uniref:hypothetical protein n=1 Tax=Haloplanus sp. GCM10025708 TaxID=3252679 RepID=UPI003614BDE1
MTTSGSSTPRRPRTAGSVRTTPSPNSNFGAVNDNSSGAIASAMITSFGSTPRQ